MTPQQILFYQSFHLHALLYLLCYFYIFFEGSFLQFLIFSICSEMITNKNYTFAKGDLFYIIEDY